MKPLELLNKAWRLSGKKCKFNQKCIFEALLWNHNENILFFFKRYGDFGDHSAIKTTDQKVQQMKIIIEDQLKEASNQIISDETDSKEVLTHLTDSLATGM